MEPKDCPKFRACSAMICPIDKEWYKRVHLSGERVCIYLTEYYKEQGSSDNIPLGVCRSLDRNAEDIMLKYGIIRNQVCISSTVPSRITQFKNRLKAQSPA